MTQEPQKSNTVLIVIAIIGVIGTIVASVIGVMGNYNIEKLRQEAELTKIALISIATQGGATQASMANTISAPTNTFYPTSEPQSTYTLPPTFTDSPPPTILPTTTPKPYYDQGETVVLKDGIYMYLSEDFLTAGGMCGKPEIGFGVKIVIENNINEQYLVRFNSSDFHAVDNLGNEYKLVAIGNGVGFCSDPIGVPSEYTMSWGYWTSYIPMQFQGQIPLETTYILITADWISGVGPIVFKKDIN